ncbi:MAG: DUF4301 family protein, partial [Bacteroidaceae bacterium]|nr:DUF4301 family protein [Bacteroidaceae bacterium]
MITSQDKELLAKKRITEARINSQMGCLVKGFPYMKLFAAASLQNGIMVFTNEEQMKYLAIWDNYKESGKKMEKFVPASGAASRMFKNLFG